MDEELGDLYNKFYTAFRLIDGVGPKLAHMCAESAVEVCNAIVEEVETDGNSGESVPEFPWHLLPNSVEYVRFSGLGGDDPLILLRPDDKLDRDHICTDYGCESNALDWKDIPDYYKDPSWDDETLERPPTV